MKGLYEMIFKRKSFRRYNEELNLTKAELEDIKEKIKELSPLVSDIETESMIVPREKTTSKRGECCLLIYSEEKEHYLLNIGYMFEQLDLYLASKNIGVCWYGMARVKEPQSENLKYIIMMSLGKGLENEFRQDYTKCKRKETEEIWKGDLAEQIGNIVKYAPSACNTQPWRVVCGNNKIDVYRATTVLSIIPKRLVPFYNSIDMGIFLCIMEIVLARNGFTFERIIKPEISESLRAVPVATYVLNK